MKTSSKFEVYAVLAYLAFALLACIGWGMNLVAVVHLFVSNAPLSAMYLVRLIGVPVFAIGSIIGWF